VRRQVGEDRAEDRLYDVRLRGRLRGELVRLDDAAIEGIRRQPRIAQRLPPTFHLVFDVGAAESPLAKHRDAIRNLLLRHPVVTALLGRCVGGHSRRHGPSRRPHGEPS